MNQKNIKKQTYKGSMVFADGIDIFFKFAFEKEIWGIRELAKELNIDKSKTFRLIHTMVDKKLLDKTDDKKYKISLKFWKMAVEIFKKIDYLNIVLPIMEKLSSLTNETILYWLVNKQQITFVHRILSDHPLQFLIELGTNYPISKGATSKIVMANMTPTELEKIIKKNFSHYNKKRLDTLYEQLNEARIKGYSVSIGERVPGTVGIASAICNENGRVVAGVSIILPAIRYNHENVNYYGNLLY